MLHSAELESPRLTPDWKDSGVIEGLLALVSLIVLVVVTMLIVAVWKMIPPGPVKNGSHAMGYTVLADGSTVRVVAVTVGPYHQAIYRFPPANHWESYWGIERSEFLRWGRDHAAIRVWVTRHPSASTTAARFDSLRHASIEWGSSRIVREQRIGQVFRRPDGEFERLCPSPLESLTPGPADVVFTQMDFPLMSDPGCPVTIRLQDDDAVELGKIQLMLPSDELRKAIRD
jgi:hypothetical protein